MLWTIEKAGVDLSGPDHNGLAMRMAHRARRSMLGLAFIVLSGACDTDSLVELADPDLITLGVAQDTSNIDALRNGALFEFGRAVTGPAENNATPGIIGIGGLLTDEMWYASTFTDMKSIDARSILDTNSDVEIVFLYLHRARNLAEQTAELYASARPDSPDRALLTNVAGYTYLFFAENYCSGVPLSEAELGGQLVFGQGRTTDELLTLAIERFDSAIQVAEAAGSTEQLDLARVGKARALQGLGSFDEAASVAAQVTDGFSYAVEYSDNASAPNNGLWYNINSESRSSVASGDGVNGLTFFARGPGPNTIDPRVAVDSAGTGLGSEVPRYDQLKYDERGTDVPLATSTEARLIEAEALLAGGQSAAYLSILNDLRSEVGLGALTDPGTPDARILQLYQERAFWLWLTGHRLGDLRRLMRHYGFTEDEVFPVGETIFGELTGDDVNFPIPFVERNNPAFEGGCYDRNA